MPPLDPAAEKLLGLLEKLTAEVASMAAAIKTNTESNEKLEETLGELCDLLQGLGGTMKVGSLLGGIFGKG